MEKIDLVKQDKEYYSAKKKPEIREFKKLNFLEISGKGEPAGIEFTKAVEALYPLAYGIEKIHEIQFKKITEGKCIQIMHIGPYSTEPETINQMKEFITQNGFIENGLHHEIYLSDPRKTEPEKMKTILRQPVK